MGSCFHQKFVATGKALTVGSKGSKIFLLVSCSAEGRGSGVGVFVVAVFYF